MNVINLDSIRAAAEGIREHVVRTPLTPAARLAESLNCELFLKLESLQFTGSFKDRGACWKLMNLEEDQAKRGVIAMSAGNHAQGVAYHARRLGIPATIVMPEFAPFSKVERTRAFGALAIRWTLPALPRGRSQKRKASPSSILTTTPSSCRGKARLDWSSSKTFRTWTALSSPLGAAASSAVLPPR